MLLHTIDMITRSHDILATNIHKYAALSHSAYICMLFDDETIEYWLVLNCVTRAWLWTEGRLKFDKQHISPLFTWCLPIDSIPDSVPSSRSCLTGGFHDIHVGSGGRTGESANGEILASAKMEVDFVEYFWCFFSGKVRPCFSRAYIGLKISSAVPG